jgi:hypothetical protein
VQQEIIPPSKKTVPNPEEIPELLSKVINTKPEEDEVVCDLANEENVALIAFIAPYVGVRISPVEEARAYIGLPDEFGMEALVRELEAAKIRKAYLLVNSLGGAMASSYKIARAVRMCLEEIVTFLPHIAASGGTLLALTGNEIVMGPMSHITPLDVQIPYKETKVSTATFMRFFTRASGWFEKVTPHEAPYPRKALADKLDPLIMEEWSGLTITMSDYVEEILGLAGYEESARIARLLVTAFPCHDYVITPEKAKEIGLNVKNSSEFQRIWDVMRYWLSKYIFEQEMMHCIRYALPHPTSQAQQLSDKETNG